MDRDRTYTSSLGFVAMLGGALFAILIVLFTAVLSDQATGPLVSTASLLILLAVLLLLPGVIGVYLAHREVFGRVEKAVVVAHAAALLYLPVYQLVTALFGSMPYAKLIGLADMVAFLLGGVGMGVAVAYRDTFENGRLGGSLLAVAILLAVGLQPALAAVGLENALPELFVAVVGVGPLGVAWLILGYDMLLFREPGSAAAEASAASEG